MKAFPSQHQRAITPPKFPRQASLTSQAFTLVEVVLALGIVSFGFLGIFSLLPAGVGAFRSGMDTSLCAQISQRIVSEAEQSDFDSLVPQNGNTVDGVATGGTSGQFYALPLRYFDDQGTELGVSDGVTPIPTLTDDEKQRVVYTVRVRGSLPGAADPSQHENAYFTSLPASPNGDYANTTRFNSRFMTILTIQIVKNPGRLSLDPFIDGASFLITGPLAANAHLPVRTFSAVVTRTCYQNAD